ncbi:hypothetical protein B5S31_g2938 [[Candida] boidinii]|nr:hypothetical protein B5S31_g2938 [[Candida] boidinii]
MDNSVTPKKSLWRSLKSVKQNSGTVIECTSGSTILDSSFSTSSNNDIGDDSQSINSFASTMSKSQKLRANFSRFSSKLTNTNSSSASPSSLSSNSSSSSSFSSNISISSYSSSASSSQLPNFNHTNNPNWDNIPNYGKTGSRTSVATVDSNATVVSRKEKMIKNIDQCNEPNKDNKQTCINTDRFTLIASGLPTTHPINNAVIQDSLLDSEVSSYSTCNENSLVENKSERRHEIPNKTLNPALNPSLNQVRNLNFTKPPFFKPQCINDQTLNSNNALINNRTGVSLRQTNADDHIKKRYSILVPNRVSGIYMKSDYNDFFLTANDDIDDIDEDYLKFKEDLTFDVSIDEDENEYSTSSSSTIKSVASVAKHTENVNKNKTTDLCSKTTENKYRINAETSESSVLEQKAKNYTIDNDESLLMKSAFDEYQLALEAFSISEPDSSTTSRHNATTTATAATNSHPTTSPPESNLRHDTSSSPVLSSLVSFPSTPKSLTPGATKSNSFSSESSSTLSSSTLSHSNFLLKDFLMLGGNLSNIEEFANVEINDYAGVIVVGPPIAYDTQLDDKHNLFKNGSDIDLLIRINNETYNNIFDLEYIFDYESTQILETDMKTKQGINKTSSFNINNDEISSKKFRKVQRTPLHFC